MGFINKIIQFVLFISVLLVVILSTFVGVFSSNQRLTQALDKSGFYKSAAILMSKTLKDQVVTDSPVLTELIKNSISSTVNSDLAKNVIQPSQIVFVEWLNSNSKDLEVNLDLLGLKNKITATSGNSQVKFEITKLLPDNFELMAANNKSDENIIGQLEQIRSIYSFTKKYLPYLWLTIGASALLLLVLNIRSGSKKVTRIFYPAVGAAIIGIILALISSYGSDLIISNLSATSQANSGALVVKLLLTILQETLNIFVATAIAAVVGSIIAKAIYRSRDKELKKKRRHKK
jgi:Na+-transporting NADH:ubiquinone oxidoreductase subunit NqrC